MMPIPSLQRVASIARVLLCGVLSPELSLCGPDMSLGSLSWGKEIRWPDTMWLPVVLECAAWLLQASPPHPFDTGAITLVIAELKCQLLWT